MTTTKRIVTVAVFGLGLAACSSGGSSSSTPTTSTPTTSTQSPTQAFLSTMSNNADFTGIPASVQVQAGQDACSSLQGINSSGGDQPEIASGTANADILIDDAEGQAMDVLLGAVATGTPGVSQAETQNPATQNLTPADEADTVGAAVSSLCTQYASAVQNYGSSASPPITNVTSTAAPTPTTIPPTAVPSLANAGSMAQACQDITAGEIRLVPPLTKPEAREILEACNPNEYVESTTSQGNQSCAWLSEGNTFIGSYGSPGTDFQGEVPEGDVTTNAEAEAILAFMVEGGIYYDCSGYYSAAVSYFDEIGAASLPFTSETYREPTTPTTVPPPAVPAVDQKFVNAVSALNEFSEAPSSIWIQAGNTACTDLGKNDGTGQPQASVDAGKTADGAAMYVLQLAGVTGIFTSDMVTLVNDAATDLCPQYASVDAAWNAAGSPGD